MQHIDLLLEAFNRHCLLASAFTFLAGAWLGLRTQLYFERRREFNAAAIELRAQLQPIRSQPHPYQAALDSRAVDIALHSCGLPWQRWRIRRRLRQLEQARQQATQADAHGSHHYPHAALVAQAAEALHQALEPR